ncbi:MAG: S4 domain-containing protein, partial [Rariglobus sp.]
EVTKLVHGEAAYDGALKASAILFGAEIGDTTEDVFRDVVGEIPTKEITSAQLAAPGLGLTDALVHAGLSQSKGQAKKDIEGGGVYINNVKVTDTAKTLTTSDLLFGKHVLLRKGKRTYAVLNVAA